MGNRNAGFAVAALLAFNAFAADPSTDLLAAAVRGHIEQVQSLLATGANLEAQDKNGRTPLMLAAQHGHSEIVRMLLAKGANAGARDRLGLTAYGLTFTSPVGGRHEDVQSALPPPEGMRVAVSAAWIPEDLISSCFMSRRELLQQVDEMSLDSLILAAIQGIAGAGPLQIVRVYRHGMAPVPESDALGGADALLTLQVRPGAACAQPSGDSLSLAIDARVLRARDHVMIFKETFGGGLKGLGVRTVANPTQYFSIYQPWVSTHAASIERSVLSILLKTEP